jgi:hypothetical protein
MGYRQRLHSRSRQGATQALQSRAGTLADRFHLIGTPAGENNLDIARAPHSHCTLFAALLDPGGAIRFVHCGNLTLDS